MYLVQEYFYTVRYIIKLFSNTFLDSRGRCWWGCVWMSHSWGRGKRLPSSFYWIKFFHTRDVFTNVTILLWPHQFVMWKAKKFYFSHFLYPVPSLSRFYPIIFYWIFLIPIRIRYLILFRTLYALSLTMRTVFNFFNWICSSHTSLVLRIKLDWILKKDANMQFLWIRYLAGGGGGGNFTIKSSVLVPDPEGQNLPKKK